MLARNNNATRNAAGFTLVELVLVMLVLATITGLIAPTLSRSVKSRNLNEEAVRLLALTEYGRDEAMSQGVPVRVWLDPETGSYGVDAVEGYPDSGIRAKQFTMNPDVHLDLADQSAPRTPDGYVDMIEFDPDGAPTYSYGIDSVRLVDRFNSTLLLSRTVDGWGYEILKEDPNVIR